MANLLYQYQRIQQTKEGLKNKKKQNLKTQNKSVVLTQVLKCSTVVDFELVHLSKPLNRGCYHGPSVSACLSVFCEFWHSMITTTVQWVPRVFYGAQLSWRPFLVTLLGCSKRVARLRGETRKCSIKVSCKC